MLKRYKISAIVLFIIICVSFFMTGYKENYENNEKVSLAYYGESTELPLLTAFQEGYFKDEGLDVEIVKLNYQDFVNSMNNKTIDGGTCDYRIIKNIEDGANIKIGAGLQSGAIEILATNGGKIETINDLKNKKIGIQDKGGGTMVAAKTLFDKYNIDFFKDINWVYLDEEQLITSLRSGNVDGVILWQNDVNYDEFKTIFKSSDVNSVSSSGHNHHGNEYFYIEFAGVSKELADTCPQKTAGILRAWIKGVNKVGENKEECLKKAIDNGYIKGSYEDNYEKIKQFMWMPSVKYAEDNLKAYIRLQKSIGILLESEQEDEFYKKSFADVLPYWS